MRPDRPRQQVLLGGRDVTDRCDQITYSSTDQGGFEIATLGLPAADRPAKGTPVTIRSGLEVAWYGRTAEVSDETTHGLATRTVGCEGWVGVMRDNPMQMIYVDRDLTKWSDPALGRQIALTAAFEQLGATQAGSDLATGLPALIQTIADSWATPYTPMAETWYDAGPGNAIQWIYYDTLTGSDAFATIAGLNAKVSFSEDDQYIAPQVSGNLTTLAGIANYAQASPATRHAVLQLYTLTTGQGVQGGSYQQYWRNIAAYGPHGLAGFGPDPTGVLPADVAAHALSQCAQILPGVIDRTVSYIAPHVTYPTPTTPDVIVTDMAKLMGWTWGVWEPPTILDSQPRMDFRAPPTDATCVISKAECDQLDVTARLGDLYSTALVTFTDPAGTAGLASVTIVNPLLSEAGIAGRTLTLDLGEGSQEAAAAFGLFALQLSQVSARAAGQATLPAYVRLAGGASKPAELIRPGIDRLRILDLLDGGPLLAQGASRRDVFRISRAETTVAKDGSASTRVEIDSGSNLLETLQARLALAAGVVGAGASGG